ncbi:MAG: phage holin family protein [Bacteroidales bacterium]
MEKTRIADNISEVVDASKTYIEANLKLFKLSLLERLSKVVSLIISTTLVMLVGMLFVLFLSLSAAIFIGSLLNNMALGFLIMGLFFLVIVLFLWAKRKTLVLNPIIRTLNDIVFEDTENNEDED